MPAYRLCPLFLAFAIVSPLAVAQSPLPADLFPDHSDVGAVQLPGTTHFNAGDGSYTISGSGDNTWFSTDKLQYAWKRVESPDVTLSAAIRFEGKGSNPHRKAMLMIRQSLDPDAPYVDIARHGDGLTSLQYRDAKGATTREVETSLSGPPSLRLVKRGDFFYVLYAGTDGVWHFSGASMKLPMHGAFYVGLAVCSHEAHLAETAVFSHVQLVTGIGNTGGGMLVSTLETVPIASTDRRVAYTDANHFEAPNWLHDNSGFLINEGGRLYKVSAQPKGGEPGAGPRMTWDGVAPRSIDSGKQTKLNNDHGLSPDGRRVAFSDSTEPGGSRIYTMPLGGGTPKQITQDAPSYWHSWSPDGRTLAFTGERSSAFDIYTVPAKGGAPKQLTHNAGFNDGPDYSPDGRWIYFNSTRSGHMQIWRMHLDGSATEQVIHDATEDWFPHPSPDGKSIVYLAYPPGTQGHPGGRDVTLQLMPASGGTAHLIAKLWGGQGTMNVSSWSPNSNEVAFVSYALLPPDATK